MTTIKQLRLRGFKSFPKLVEIPFENGYNCIIGSNGAGKSNVVDAICFVLGKISAKSLRAEKSANLIYHGGKKGQPAKEAQVDIVFDNSKNDFPIKGNELKVSRIVKQNGNSTYKLNDDVVTRQQVVDLLGQAKIDPDGHNIILQGDIIHFMEMKPEERRELMEEIAGISIYEDKKQKAMNELEKVDSKLNEASIILTERETYMKELKRERDQAEKHNEIESDIKSNKATYLHLQIKDREEKKDEIEKKIKEQTNERDKHESEINEIKKYIASKKNELSGINKEIESKGEVEQKKIHVDIEKLKIDIVKNSTRLETCNSELEKINARKKQLEKSLDETNKNIDELKRKKDKIEKEIKSCSIEGIRANDAITKFKEKHNIKEDFVKSMDDVDSSIEKNQAETTRISHDMQEKVRELDKTSFEINGLKIAENKEKIDQIKALRADFKDVANELSKMQNELAVTETQEAKARRTIIELDEKKAKANAHSIGMQEFNSMDIALKKIMGLGDKGVIGAVSDLGKIQSKYSTALSVAAGPRIKSIVVDNDVTAARCIGYLKENKLGVVTFLPLNKMKSRPLQDEVRPLLNLPNICGLASDLIEYDKRYRDVFNYVFGSTVVVEDLGIARKIGVGRARMVTLDGDLVETSGAMVGGFRRKIPGFKEKDFDADVKLLEGDIEKNKKLLDLLENKEDELNEGIKELRNKKANIEAEILKFEKVYGITDIDALKEKRDKLLEKEKETSREISNYEKELASLNNETIKLKALRSKIKEKAADSDVANNLNKLEEEKAKIKENLLSLKAELSNTDIQINNIFNQEKDKIAALISSGEKERNEFANEINNLNSALKDQKNELKEKESLQKRFYSDYNNLFVKRKRTEEDMNKKELGMVKNEERIKSIQQRLNSVEIDRAKVVAELAGLSHEFEQFKDEKIRRGLSLQDLKDDINKLENMIKNMGNVNMRALEIYNEAEIEYNKIIEKTSKLKIEKDDVLKLMSEIEGKKKDIFIKTYKVIANNFKSIFGNLSTKGEAYLEICNEDDLFNNGGVDIKVKIASNKFLDLKSLSGGEKSMAALSFIFAIQEYWPASFYLLDEVDAALDKTNSDLLSKLIKKYSDKAQYIVVSHNDQVITEADTIYGVSMQDAISKVVSLKI